MLSNARFHAQLLHLVREFDRISEDEQKTLPLLENNDRHRQYSSGTTILILVRSRGTCRRGDFPSLWKQLIMVISFVPRLLRGVTQTSRLRVAMPRLESCNHKVPQRII